VNYTVVSIDVDVHRTDGLVYRKVGFDLRRDPSVFDLLGHGLVLR